MFYSILKESARPVGHPRLRFKDVLSKISKVLVWNMRNEQHYSKIEIFSEPKYMLGKEMNQKISRLGIQNIIADLYSIVGDNRRLPKL